jgi:hypothetical protein
MYPNRRNVHIRGSLCASASCACPRVICAHPADVGTSGQRICTALGKLCIFRSMCRVGVPSRATDFHRLPAEVQRLHTDVQRLPADVHRLPARVLRISRGCAENTAEVIHNRPMSPHPPDVQSPAHPADVQRFDRCESQLCAISAHPWANPMHIRRMCASGDTICAHLRVFSAPSFEVCPTSAGFADTIADAVHRLPADVYKLWADVPTPRVCRGPENLWRPAGCAESPRICTSGRFGYMTAATSIVVDVHIPPPKRHSWRLRRSSACRPLTSPQ